MNAVLSFEQEKFVRFAQYQTHDTLRVVTCGSVDDGKSTLIGRLLFESQQIPDDVLDALVADSQKYGTVPNGIDFALLLDGLVAEREQGITIDVAYRYFFTATRNYIIADAPGHEQYTRNMATGASTADVAIILVDARKGILPQTKRHSLIVSMFGVSQVVLAVNKMDLVDFSEDIWQKISTEYANIADRLGMLSVHTIPMAACFGDNLVEHSSHMPWYQGVTLLQYLEQVPQGRGLAEKPFRMAIQGGCRPNAEFRGITGRIASGRLDCGDKVRILPSRVVAEVASIVGFEQNLTSATAGQSVLLTVKDPVDISRGDVLSSIDMPCRVADQVAARILWMSDTPWMPACQYLLKLGTSTVSAILNKPNYAIDINTLEQKNIDHISLNEVFYCEMTLDRPLVFERFQDNQELGSFLLIDRRTKETMAAGVIESQVSQLRYVVPQPLSVDRQMRSRLKQQVPRVLWFTGLSGSGKSTLANLLELELHAMSRHTMLLDGDNLRCALNYDLTFTEQDRTENIRRVAEVAKLFCDAGVITIVAMISPRAQDRQMAKNIIGAEQFIEIYMEAPLSVLEARDKKGLYQKARSGKISHFTGITSPYEPPKQPDVLLNSANYHAMESLEQLLDILRQKYNF